MNLYQINAEILSLIDEETGEVKDFDKFSEMHLALDEKKENVALYIKNLKAEVDAIGNEIDSLTERKNTKKEQAERLSEYLSNFLNGERFETAKVSCSFRKSTVCEVANESEFLTKYPEFAKPQPPKLNKSDVKTALKNGTKLTGAVLIDKQNLVVR